MLAGSNCRVGSFLGANTMIQCVDFGCNNNRINPGKDGSSRLHSFHYFPLKLTLIIIQHLFMRHISSHCGHSEAHYKHLHIINNIMIKMPTVKLQDKI